MSTEKISLEVAIEVVLRNGPNFELLAGLCKMAVEAEREACAEVADYMAGRCKHPDEIADAIRARGETK
jgi:hypothetical protein